MEKHTTQGDTKLGIICHHNSSCNMAANILLLPYVRSANCLSKIYRIKGIWEVHRLGDNFIKFFNSYNFGRVIGHTLSIIVYDLIAGFPFPIILAILLNNCLKKRYKKFVQIVTYMPYFISTVVMVGIIIQFLSPKVGIVNHAIRAFGGTEIDFMAKPELFKHIYVWSSIWQGTGWTAIIYLSALSSVDPGLHEAALVDGANRFQRMWFIDLPCLLPTIAIMLTLRAGSIMSVGFEKAFLMQNNLNIRASR